jgi:adenine phosphoribosyltransferase
VTVDLRAYVRDVPDFPKPGILFRDITPILAHPDALATALTELARPFERPAAVVGIESRGFLFGIGLALHWRVPFVPARKFGKLPGRTVRERYALEYGEDQLEIHVDAFMKGVNVLVVDYLLATGGTAAATVRLVEQLDARVSGVAFVIELEGLGGREKLAGQRVHTLLKLPA